MQMKHKHCGLIRANTKFEMQITSKIFCHFTACGKHAKPACTYCVTSQAFQAVILLYHFDLS